MKKILCIIPLMILISFVHANNIQISSISTTQVNGNNIINFNLTWENSWRTASTNNYDGAWIFFRYKDNDGTWKPLRFTGSNVTAPAGYTVQISNNGPVVGIGAFIHRSALGFGNVNITNIKAGVQSFPGTFDVKGFALEMVYIPAGSFYVGDSTGRSLGSSYQAGDVIAPYQVTGNGSTVQLGAVAGRLNGLLEYASTVTLTGFPVGYSAYWIMKYELSLGAWRDFINVLTYEQQTTLYIDEDSLQGSLISAGLYRGRLELATKGNSTTGAPAVLACDYDNDNVYDEATDGEWIAMGMLTWPMMAAYLDWAGLRPMSEMEFEKACRGPLAAKPDEFAWGTPHVSSYIYDPYTYYNYTLSNGGQNSEKITNASSVEGNAIFSITPGNVRGGIFAGAFSTRVSAGAGYYGAMELSGNMEELCVTTANPAGRSYTGKHGNQELTHGGYADVDYWPGSNGNNDIFAANGQADGVQAIWGIAGIMERGSSTANGVLKMSHRQGYVSPTKRAEYGLRGARDAD